MKGRGRRVVKGGKGMGKELARDKRKTEGCSDVTARYHVINVDNDQ